jgi:hypothetical protein
MPIDEEMPTDEEIRRLLEEAPSGFTSYELQLIVTRGLTIEQAQGWAD